MHCIRDAVQKGDTQILENVKDATNHLQTVFDQLMEYYTGGLADMQTYMVANQGVISGIIKTIPGVKAMFTEMKDMLGGDLDQEGRVTATRALNHFHNKLSTITPEQFANASALMNDISSEATTLLHTARLASSRKLSTRSAAARQTMESMYSLNKVLRVESEMIHTYRHYSASKKHRQQAIINPIAAVKDEVVRLNMNSILTDLDRSWWTIRTKLDAYLDAAQNQAVAFGDALKAIDDYTSKCALDIKDLNEVHRRTLRVDDAAYQQLHETWYAVIEELGVLTSRINDNRAFLQLLRFDYDNMDLSAHRSEICSDSAESKKALDDRIFQAMKDSFTHQTWQQLQAVFTEMDMLETRFFTHGRQVPTDNHWKESAERAIRAIYAAYEEGGDSRAEVAARTCGKATPRGLALAQTSEGADEPALIEVGKDMQVSSQEVRKNADATREMRFEIRVLAFVCVVLMGALALDKMTPILRQKLSGKVERGEAEASCQDT